MTFHGFPREMFAFLADLAANNDRQWFQEHKGRYERYVKEPTIAFVAAMKEPLARVSPSYVADTRVNGGSMFRIYRDTRFSRDKSPYKTNVGCQFRHSAGKDAHAPGFYIHLEPGGGFVGGGVWRPPAPALAKIRDAMDRYPEEWTRVKDFVTRQAGLTFGDDEKLARTPKGFPPDHPLAEDLRLKTIYAWRGVGESDVSGSEFLETVESTFQDLAPLMRFINEAMGLSF